MTRLLYYPTLALLIQSVSTPSTLAATTAPPEPNDTDTQHLHKVIVTGTRLPTDLALAPVMVDVITRDDPTLSTATRIEDVLDDQPGLTVAGSGRRNGQTLSMRGFDKDGVLVRIDGVRQDINTGHLGNFFIDPALLSQVQIARGALSSLYGSNAMGGVISLETVDASDLLRAGESSGARLALQGATASHQGGAMATLFGRSDTSKGALDGLLALGRSESGDIRRAGGQQAEDDATLDNLLAKGSWQLSPAHQLFASWHRYDEDVTQPSNPQSLAVDESNPLTERATISDNAQFGHRWTSGQATQLDTRLTLSRQDIEEPDAAREHRRYGLQSDGFQLLDHGWLHQALAFGAEVTQADQVPSGSASGFPKADIDTAAVYLDDTFTVGSYASGGEFDLGLGLRYDHYRAEDNDDRKSDESHLSPRLRLAWRPTADWLLYTGYAEAFRAPTLSELYANERHFAGSCPSPFFCMPDNYWIPNPDLKPETSASWESGIAWHSGDWSARASYFDTHADDFVDTQVDILAGTTQAVNVSRAHLWGYDARLAWRPNAWHSFIGLSKVDGRDEYSGEPLGTLTPLELLTGIDYHFFAPDLSVGWRGRFARSFDTADDAQLPGYGLHDVQMAWQFTPSFAASLKLRNVADKVWYRANGSLGDGRSLLANLSMQW